jgi:hypothetical protein
MGNRQLYVEKVTLAIETSPKGTRPQPTLPQLTEPTWGIGSSLLCTDTVNPDRSIPGAKHPQSTLPQPNGFPWGTGSLLLLTRHYQSSRSERSFRTLHHIFPTGNPPHSKSILNDSLAFHFSSNPTSRTASISSRSTHSNDLSHHTLHP